MWFSVVISFCIVIVLPVVGIRSNARLICMSSSFFSSIQFLMCARLWCWRRRNHHVSWLSVTSTYTTNHFMASSGHQFALLCSRSPNTVPWSTILYPIVNRSSCRWLNLELTTLSGPRVKDLYVISRSIPAMMQKQPRHKKSVLHFF